MSALVRLLRTNGFFLRVRLDIVPVFLFFGGGGATIEVSGGSSLFFIMCDNLLDPAVTSVFPMFLTAGELMGAAALRSPVKILPRPAP